MPSEGLTKAPGLASELVAGQATSTPGGHRVRRQGFARLQPNPIRALRAVAILLALLGMVASSVVAQPPGRAQAATSARYFSQTGHWVQGDFLTFFDDHGGIDLFGYPRTEPFYSDGRVVQYFQRARFESWPENAPPYKVQLMLIGDAVTGPGDPPVSRPADPSFAYFPQTGHTLSGPFRSFFDGRGGLAIFGYPTSEPTMGSTGFLVQRFQRARMELHSELPDPYKVSLGLLGDEYIFLLGRVPLAATQAVDGTVPPTPSAMPFGRIVLETSPGGNLVVENLDGSAAGVVAQGLDPAWSPDGKMIAYSDWGGDPGIYVVNADGTGRHKVFTMPFTRDPQWSPDGSRIAFYRRYDGHIIVNNVSQADDWFQVMVLKLSDGSTWLPPDQQTHAYASTWSPDGQSLLFQQYDGLYLTKLSGPDQEPHLVAGTNQSFTTPAWSPDGFHVAVTYWNHDHWDVGVMNPDGSAFQLLTFDPSSSSPSNSAAATWSPKGDKLIFLSDRSGTYQLYAMNPDGSQVTPLNGQTVQYTGSFARAVSWKP